MKIKRRNCGILLLVLFMSVSSCAGGKADMSSKQEITWQKAEIIARAELLKQTTRKQGPPPDSVHIAKCALVRTIGFDMADSYMFLVEIRWRGSLNPLYGKVFVQSSGETLPSDGTGNPIHSITEAEYKAYYDPDSMKVAFALRRSGKPGPEFWSLVQSTPNTIGQVTLRDGVRYPLGDFIITSHLAVWLVTDSLGNDFMVFSNDDVSQVFDLDPKVKIRIGHCRADSTGDLR